jgi:dihydrofolate reductase
MIWDMEVFLIAALTLDGFLGRDEQHSSINWRSQADADFFISKTKEARSVVMGSRTFLTMKRPMPGRKHFVLTSDPSKFEQYDSEQVLAMTATPQEVVDQAIKDGFEQLAICGGSSVYTQFVEADLVDRFYLTIEPLFFGEGIGLLNKPMSKHLKLVAVHQISDQSIVLELTRKND